MTPTSPKKSVTGLAELIANRAVAAATTTQNNGNDDSSPQLLRCDNPVPAGYIVPFPRGAVGPQYVVIKGVQPGIYSDWYATFSAFILLLHP